MRIPDSLFFRYSVPLCVSAIIFAGLVLTGQNAAAGGGDGDGILENVQSTKQMRKSAKKRRYKKSRRVSRKRGSSRPVPYTPPAAIYGQPMPAGPPATGLSGGTAPLAPPPGMVPPQPAPPPVALPPGLANNPFINPPILRPSNPNQTYIGMPGPAGRPMAPRRGEIAGGSDGLIPGVGAPPPVDPDMAVKMVGHFGNAVSTPVKIGQAITAVTTGVDLAELSSAKNEKEFIEKYDKAVRGAFTTGAASGGGTMGGALGGPAAPATSVLGSVLGEGTAGLAYDTFMKAGVQKKAREAYAALHRK